MDGLLRDGRKNKWRGKKIRALKVADAYKRLGFVERSFRVGHCGSQLEFDVDLDTGRKRLRAADFCKDRLCPMCAWRRSLRVAYVLEDVLSTVRRENPGLVPVFLTLTLRNCEAVRLGETLDVIFKGWNRLTSNKRIKRVVKGWFRSLEITYNEDSDTFHPHIHALIMVDREYFTGDDYIETAEWARLWRKALKLDYTPVCDARKVKGGNKAILEVSKYVVKDTDYISNDVRKMDRLMLILVNALYRRRLYAFGGLLRKVAQMKNVDDGGEGDLVHVGDEKGAFPDGSRVVRAVYRWDSKKMDYVLEVVSDDGGGGSSGRKAPPGRKRKR